MDGLNIYLGVGIVLVLAAILGEIEALGVKVPPLRSRKLRLVLAGLGVVSIVAAYIAPLPGTAATIRKDEEAAYQRQVLAACDSISATKRLGDNALRLDDKGNILRDPFVALLQRQVAQNEATLGQLWSQKTPEDLRDTRDDARATGQAALDAARRLIDRVRALPPAFTQEQLDAVGSQFEAEGGSQNWTRFGSAMSRLAGETCKLPA